MYLPHSNQNSKGMPQSSVGLTAFPSRILIEILEEFQSHLMYLTQKFPTDLGFNSKNPFAIVLISIGILKNIY